MSWSSSRLALVLALAGAAWAQELAVTFAGNRAIPSEDLARLIAPELAIHAGRPDVAAAVDDAAFLIGRQYRRLGYRSAVVEYRVDPADPRRVEFRIEEGEVWRTAGDVVPVLARPVPGFLERWAAGSKYGRSPLLGGHPVFVEDLLLDDLDDARGWLEDEGYDTPRFETSIDPARDGSPTVLVGVAVDPGPRTIVGSLSFEGAPGRDARDLLSRLGLVPWPAAPVPFSSAWLRAVVVRLQESYRDESFHDVAVRTRVERVEEVSPDLRRAHVALVVEPGPPHRIGRVEVAGARAADPDEVRRVFGVHPGDPYDEARIAEGRHRLLRLAYLADVAIMETEHPGETPAVDLAIQVREQPFATVGLSVGIGVLERYRAEAEIEVNDVLGAGRDVVLEGQVGDGWRRLELDLVDEHFLGGLDTKLAVGPYVGREEREPFTLHRLGAELELDHRVGPGLTASAGWAFEFADLRDLGDGLDRTGEADEFFAGPRVGWSYQAVDDPAGPTRGFTAGAAADTSLSALGATQDLVGFGARAGFYYPLPHVEGHDLVLFLGARAEAVQPLFDEERVAIQRRLFNGGPDSVRSFELDRLGPVNELGTPIGGELATVATAEVRFRIWNDLWGVVFTDAGTVAEELERFPGDHPGWAVGAGLRYQTPIGPLRLEFAVNPDRHAGERTEDAYEFLLTLGFRF